MMLSWPLCASESALPGTAPAEALHTFTLDSGASCCFFRDSTTLTPLSAPVPVRVADPSGGPVLARSSTVLPCPAVPSGSLSGLHLPSFSTNLVSTAALQDAMVTTTTPGGQRVSICTCTRTGRHLATFTRRCGSSLYTLATNPPHVAASAQVSVSGPVAPPCSCRLVSHQTLLWHHRLGHPSLPCLGGMHSRLLVSGLPRSLPPLLPLPAPPCLRCVEGGQRAAPHSSFPPTTAPLQTLHMDVWGPARVSGQGRERYFLLVVDDYTRYTMVFPLRSKGEVPDVLIPWIRAVRLQLRERFRQDLPVLRLHSDRGGEFSSDLLWDFCRGEGILQSFTLPASPQQNGIAERRIGLVIEVARTSMIHAVAPHFLWPFAVRYVAHQLNLWPRVSLPETSPTLCWTGEVGDASVVRGPAPSGVSQVDPLPSTVLVEVAVDSGAAREIYFDIGGAEPEGAGSEGARSGGAEFGGAEPAGAEPGGAEPEGVGPGGAESEGAESGGAEPWGTASSGGPAGPSPRLSPWQEPLSPQQLRDWFAQRTHLRSGAVGARDSAAGGTGAGGIGATRLGGARVTAGAGGTRGAVAAGPGGARTRGTGATGTGSVEGAGGAEGAGAGDPAEPGGAGAEGAGAGGTGAGGAGAGATRAVDAGAGGAGAGGAVSGGTSAGGTVWPLLSQPPCQSQPHLEPDSPLPAPSPYAERTTSFTEHREPESHPASPVRALRTGLRVPRPRPPPVPGTHAMALPPSSVLLRVPLPPPPESSLPAVLDPESDLARTASPIVSRLLATAVIDPSFESNTVSALVAELDDFATVCHLDYATALGTDILEDRQEDFDFLAATAPHLVAMLLAPEGDPDAPDIPTPRSYAEAITGTYVDAVLPSGANIVNGMWIFRVKWPQGSLPPFKARYVARGFTPPSDESVEPSGLYLELVGCLIYLMTCTRPDLAYPLSILARYVAPGRHRPEHWEAAKRVLHYLCSTSGMGLVLGGRGPVVLIGHADASWVDDLATQWSSQGYTFSLGSDSVSCRSTRSSSVLSSSCEAEIYAGAMAAQELHWLTYLLTDLGEQPRSPPVLYVDNKAMSALCQENRVDHRTKHITLRYFLARELQQRGELRLAYVANRTNTTDIFTKALQSGAMAAQELRWLTYLLTDLGEQPRSPPVLYVDNKAMSALCQENRVEHRTKHITLRYFLARELQQRGELRLAYVSNRTNTTDIFTKALQS
ncbi:unnamed protein product, partial [Closterium sp. NIES-54]